MEHCRIKFLAKKCGNMRSQSFEDFHIHLLIITKPNVSRCNRVGESIVLFMLSVLLVSILSCWYVGVVKVVCHVGFVCVIIVVCVVLLNFI